MHEHFNGKAKDVCNTTAFKGVSTIFQSVWLTSSWLCVIYTLLWELCNFLGWKESWNSYKANLYGCGIAMQPFVRINGHMDAGLYHFSILFFFSLLHTQSWPKRFPHIVYLNMKTRLLYNNSNFDFVYCNCQKKMMVYYFWKGLKCSYKSWG